MSEQTPSLCVHAIVKGRVQGVYFRAHTEQEAQKLNLTGWVKNCRDGSVEVMACGPDTQVKKLLAWLKIGPPDAIVNDVTHKECAWQDFKDFRIVY